MKQVNERSAVDIDLEFYDKDGLPYVPTSIKYRLDCITTGTSIIPWTDYNNIDSEVTITIDAENNAMQDANNPHEEKEFVTKLNDTFSNEANAKITYKLMNLYGVT